VNEREGVSGGHRAEFVAGMIPRSLRNLQRIKPRRGPRHPKEGSSGRCPIHGTFLRVIRDDRLNPSMFRDPELPKTLPKATEGESGKSKRSLHHVVSLRWTTGELDGTSRFFRVAVGTTGCSESRDRWRLRSVSRRFWDAVLAEIYKHSVVLQRSPSGR
jgi:hypothetical protein